MTASLRRVLPVIALVAGCHSELDVRSNRLETYDSDPRRILVVAGNRLYPGAASEQVAPAIAERLGNCGIATDVLTQQERPDDNLALDEPPDPAKALQAELASRRGVFRPDAIMLVQRVGNQIRVREQYGVRSAQLTTVKYDVQLLDVPTRRTVYRAAMTLNIGPYAVLSPGRDFARLMVDRLAADQVVTRCPPPTKAP